MKPETPTRYLGGRLLSWRRRPLCPRIEIGRLQWWFSTEGDKITFGVRWWKKEP